MNTFKQNNNIIIEENGVYKSVVGELVKILSINEEKNELKCYNISDSCTSYHRIDSAINDNKFRARVR